MKVRVKTDPRGQIIGFILPDGRVVGDDEYAMWIALAHVRGEPLQDSLTVATDRVVEFVEEYARRDGVVLPPGEATARARNITQALAAFFARR